MLKAEEVKILVTIKLMMLINPMVDKILGMRMIDEMVATTIEDKAEMTDQDKLLLEIKDRIMMTEGKIADKDTLRTIIEEMMEGNHLCKDPKVTEITSYFQIKLIEAQYFNSCKTF